MQWIHVAEAHHPHIIIHHQTFNNWMDNTLDDLAEAVVCSSIADVEELQAKHEEFKAQDLQDANTKYDELNGLVTTMAEMGASDNPYTAHSAQVLPTPTPLSVR